MSGDVFSPVILLATSNSTDRDLIRSSLPEIVSQSSLIDLRDGSELLGWLQRAGNPRHRRSFPVPNLILLDLDLSGQDAFCLLRWLRRDETFDASRVCVLTRPEGFPRVHDAQQLGADSFLTTPISFSELRGCIDALRADPGSQAADRFVNE
jgi:two-component system, response regulator